jgi:mannose-6-phosphate isomerase
VIVSPARLEPIFSLRPWGSLSLSPFFPERSQLAEPVGEAWMSGSDCRFASGPFEGQKLGEAWPRMPCEWAGTEVERGGVFPLLVKFIFSDDKLSVQVHPDDDYASRHETAAGGRGKTEMWYALRARPGANVLVGLKPGVTVERFKAAIVDGTAGRGLYSAKSSSIPILPTASMITTGGTPRARGDSCTSRRPSK